MADLAVWPRWLDERDPADPVSRGHYRVLTRMEAERPAPLLPGGPACLKVGRAPLLDRLAGMLGAGPHIPWQLFILQTWADGKCGKAGGAALLVSLLLTCCRQRHNRPCVTYRPLVVSVSLVAHQRVCRSSPCPTQSEAVFAQCLMPACADYRAGLLLHAPPDPPHGWGRRTCGPRPSTAGLAARGADPPRALACAACTPAGAVPGVGQDARLVLLFRRGTRLWQHW